jgi:hypothetical protein
VWISGTKENLAVSSPGANLADIAEYSVAHSRNQWIILRSSLLAAKDADRLLVPIDIVQAQVPDLSTAKAVGCQEQ